MSGLWSWLSYAGLALFGVACIVAWWEHLGRRGGLLGAAAPAAPAPPAAVDVDLDALAIAPEAAERRLALDGVLSRMSQRDGEGASAWIDTAPMIAAGAQGAGIPSAELSLH